MQAQKYLRTRMPKSQCSVEDLENIRNNKWTVSFGI
jgi:hypothetical protein